MLIMNRSESLKSVIPGVNVMFRHYGTRHLERPMQIGGTCKAQNTLQLYIKIV
jgi:hypothetical protein